MIFTYEQIASFARGGGVSGDIAKDCLELMDKHKEFHRRAREADELVKDCSNFIQTGAIPNERFSPMLNAIRAEVGLLKADRDSAVGNMLARQENAYNNAIDHAAAKAKDCGASQLVIDEILKLRHDNFWSRR